MANKKSLSAFVRMDWTGRVVSSSLVLRKNKPKIGKWMQVRGYQCCDPFPTSTTTTTT